MDWCSPMLWLYCLIKNCIEINKHRQEKEVRYTKGEAELQCRPLKESVKLTWALELSLSWEQEIKPWYPFIVLFLEVTCFLEGSITSDQTASFILHSSFFILHSPFFILHSLLYILYFSFFILWQTVKRADSWRFSLCRYFQHWRNKPFIPEDLCENILQCHVWKPA